MQNLEIFPTEELREENFNPYDPRWDSIKKTLYHLHMTKFIEEIMRQAPINDFYKLPDIHEIRKYGREYWLDFTKTRRQWCYRIDCEFDYKEKKRITKLQSFESWMDWKKMNMYEATKNVLFYIRDHLAKTPDKAFLDFFLYEMTGTIAIYKDSYNGFAFESDLKYID
jgi:hypothetical protein